MRFLLLMLLMSLHAHVFAVTYTEPTWPSWVGVSKGADATVADKGIDQDDHTNYDYGSDSWGWWANIEVMSGATVAAVIEMRYIENKAIDYGNGAVAGAFLMGAPDNEQGAQHYEKPQVLVPQSDLNGGSGYWISAREISQDLWEKVMAVTLIEKAADDTDINNTNTVAFLAPDAITKELKAVECQTFTQAQTFCTTLAGVSGATAVRIPNEKEWEYACRSGTGTAFWTGRLLDGRLASSANLNVNTSQTMYDYSRADMDAGIVNAPNGDGGLTPPWDVGVSSVSVDGLATFNSADSITINIGGALTVNGGTVELSVTAMFDSRYQHRYVADHYGTHTPILMLYHFDGTHFVPQPYGDPNAANMYYRYLDLTIPGVRDNPSDYVACSAINTTTAVQNHYFQNLEYKKRISNFTNNGNRPLLDRFYYHEGSQPGDWYNPAPDSYETWGYDQIASKGLSNNDALSKMDLRYKQLEYREMVPVYARFTSGGVEDKDGEFIKDFDGRLYPIRSRYTPAPYWKSGIKATETAPASDGSLAGINLANLAKDTVPASKSMDTYAYLEELKDAMADYFESVATFDPGFYTGPMTGIVNFQAWSGGKFPRQRVYDKISVTIATAPTVERGDLGRNYWGLYSVHGNVEEWVDTTWDGISDYSDLTKYDTGAFQVTKGGSWRMGADRCRSASRTARDPNQGYDDVGFRIVIDN